MKPPVKNAPWIFLAAASLAFDAWIHSIAWVIVDGIVFLCFFLDAVIADDRSADAVDQRGGRVAACR